MTYLKIILPDDYQIDRIVYRLIEYIIDEELTLEHNVIIYDNKYTRKLVEEKTGDVTLDLIKIEISNNFYEVSESEFNNDIADKIEEAIK